VRMPMLNVAASTAATAANSYLISPRSGGMPLASPSGRTSLSVMCPTAGALGEIGQQLSPTSKGMPRKHSMGGAAAAAAAAGLHLGSNSSSGLNSPAGSTYSHGLSQLGHHGQTGGLQQTAAAAAALSAVYGTGTGLWRDGSGVASGAGGVSFPPGVAPPGGGGRGPAAAAAAAAAAGGRESLGGVYHGNHGVPGHTQHSVSKAAAAVAGAGGGAGRGVGASVSFSHSRGGLKQLGGEGASPWDSPGSSPDTSARGAASWGSEDALSTLQGAWNGGASSGHAAGHTTQGLYVSGHQSGAKGGGMASGSGLPGWGGSGGSRLGGLERGGSIRSRDTGMVGAAGAGMDIHGLSVMGGGGAGGGGGGHHHGGYGGAGGGGGGVGAGPGGKKPMPGGGVKPAGHLRQAGRAGHL
jgi:hypothetical protein